MADKSIWVEVPAYTGAITCETAQSLNLEMYHAYAKGYPYKVQFYQQNPIISYARNFLVREFLLTDFTDMVFVDSDVGFPPGTLCRFVEYPVDMVGAIYPYRNDTGTFPIRYVEERSELIADPATGLLEVAGVPAGCMRLSRKMLQALCDHHPELLYKDMNGIETYSLFEFTREAGQFFGEDWAFCNLVRKDGFKIWTEPNIDMTHSGLKVFKGNLERHLLARNNPNDAMAEIMAFVEKNKVGA
jgi:hypothetical protein